MPSVSEEIEVVYVPWGLHGIPARQVFRPSGWVVPPIFAGFPLQNKEIRLLLFRKINFNAVKNGLQCKIKSRDIILLFMKFIPRFAPVAALSNNFEKNKLQTETIFSTYLFLWKSLTPHQAVISRISPGRQRCSDH